MKKANDILLGVCPIGKFVFSHEDAILQKNAIFAKLDEWRYNYCHLEKVLPDGIVRDQKHVEAVVEFFQGQKIDALFVPHCNFGTEGAVGMIAKKLGVPVLLWGPRDEAPLEDCSRLRDSLCGMFASSKVLHKLHVPFTYIENCRFDEDPFRNGLDLFIRASAVVKAMRNMRIAQVGVRVDFFWTTISNESELLQKFNVQVLPVDMADLLTAVKERAKKERSTYEKELKDYEHLVLDKSVFQMEGTLNSLAMRDELTKIAEEEQIDAFSIKTFTSIQNELGPGLRLGDMLLEERYPVAAESDLHGAISSLLVEAASSVKEPSFFPEFTVRHPANDNAILLWHGLAPLSLRHPEIPQMKYYPPWILKGLPGASFQMRLKDGPLTVCRFDGENGDYVLGMGQGHTVDGPETKEIYAWMEVDNWKHWERTIMEGPYIHHCSALYDHCADALEEACKYIPGLKAQRFDMTE